MQHRGYATFASALAACRLGGADALLMSMLETITRCAALWIRASPSAVTTLPAVSQNQARTLQQAVQHCFGQHRRCFREILALVSQWGAGPTHDT